MRPSAQGAFGFCTMREFALINGICAKIKHFYFLSRLLSIDLKGAEKYNKMVYIFFILDQYVV